MRCCPKSVLAIQQKKPVRRMLAPQGAAPRGLKEHWQFSNIVCSVELSQSPKGRLSASPILGGLDGSIPKRKRSPTASLVKRVLSKVGMQIDSQTAYEFVRNYIARCDDVDFNLLAGKPS